jgi:hypothetical protein
MTTRRLQHSPLSTSSVQHQNSIQTFIASKTGGGIRFAVAVQSGCTNLGLGMLFRSNNQGSVNEGRIGCSQAAAKPTQIRNRKHLRAHELESRKIIGEQKAKSNSLVVCAFRDGGCCRERDRERSNPPT